MYAITKKTSCLRLVDGVDGDDVRMVQLRRRLRLAQEARLDLAAERELRRQDLDGDRALQAPVFGPIDDAHSAPPDLAVQLVVGRSTRSTCVRSSASAGRGERVRHSASSGQGEGAKRTL